MKFIALIVYEYLVTFDDELAFIWRSQARKSTGMRILFCLNRYLALGVAIIGAISDMVPRVSSSSTHGFLDATANISLQECVVLRPYWDTNPSAMVVGVAAPY